jgi:hypothetical protein
MYDQPALLGLARVGCGIAGGSRLGVGALGQAGLMAASWAEEKMSFSVRELPLHVLLDHRPALEAGRVR